MICHTQAVKWSMVKNQLWYSLTIKKQIIVIKSFIHIKWVFVTQNPKKMNFWITETFCRRTSWVDKFNITLRGAWQGFRNLTFKMGKLCMSQKPIFWPYLTAVVSDWQFVLMSGEMWFAFTDVTGFELNLHVVVLLLVMSLTMYHNILWQFPCSSYNKSHTVT